MTNSFHHQLHQKILLAGLALLLPVAGAAQQKKSIPAPLPADAQEAIGQGIAAAKQQDYLRAVQFFQQARKIAPHAPEIFYDLGLAESKIPGRELRAIAWLETYGRTTLPFQTP
jgi:Flp pilus assembly protein TadD